MFLISEISDDAKQLHTLIMEDGTNLVLQMEYRPQQYGWFITELTHGSFTIHGMRVVGSPNMLHQYKNKLNFGIACIVTGKREPSQQDDFSTGNAQLYILDSSEVAFYEKFLGE